MEVWPSNAPQFGETEKTTRISREAWLKSRKLCITSTMMSKCISPKHPETILKHLQNPVDISHLPFVSRGIRDEQAGVDHLLEQLEKDGIFAKAYKVGFVLHPERDWLGASPDRLLYDGRKWKLVEVKNWYETNRQRSLSDLPYLDKNQLLKRKHTYFYQIQTAMLVTGLRQCYFVVHGKESKIEEIEYDAQTAKLILDRSEVFYNNHLKDVRF